MKNLFKIVILIFLSNLNAMSNNDSIPNMNLNVLAKNFENFISHLKSNEVAMALICPVIMGGPDDPVNQEKKLSTVGFGKFTNKEFKDFIESIETGEKEYLPELERGIDYNLIVIFRMQEFNENKNTMSMRLIEDRLVFFMNIDGIDYPIELPQKSYDIFKNIIVDLVDE